MEGDCQSVGPFSSPHRSLGTREMERPLQKLQNIPRQEYQGNQPVHALSLDATYRRHVDQQQEAQHLEEGCKTFLKVQLIVINPSQKGKNPEETRLDP